MQVVVQKSIIWVFHSSFTETRGESTYLVMVSKDQLPQAYYFLCHSRHMMSSKFVHQCTSYPGTEKWSNLVCKFSHTLHNAAPWWCCALKYACKNCDPKTIKERKSLVVLCKLKENNQNWSCYGLTEDFSSPIYFLIKKIFKSCSCYWKYQFTGGGTVWPTSPCFQSWC